MAFKAPTQAYTGAIKEITLEKDGTQVTVGGETAYPFYTFEGDMPNLPKIAIQVPVTQSHPCDACHSKSCINSCPAGAVEAGGLAVAACRAHAGSTEGLACRQDGCIARNACPVGNEHRYGAGQQAFHQAAFLGP